MINIQNTTNLTSQFYQLKTEKVAKNLLGKILVRRFSGHQLAGIIVETEAYLARNDEASHSHNGLSKRNKSMYDN